jgi:hypothetical protein
MITRTCLTFPAAPLPKWTVTGVALGFGVLPGAVTLISFSSISPISFVP